MVDSRLLLVWILKLILIGSVTYKVATDELLCIKNAGTQISKIKILGTVLELPDRQPCQSRPFTAKMGQMGWIGSAAWLVAPNSHKDFNFFNCYGCQTFILAEIHCYISALKSWHNNLFKCGVVELGELFWSEKNDSLWSGCSVKA